MLHRHLLLAACAAFISLLSTTQAAPVADARAGIANQVKTIDPAKLPYEAQDWIGVKVLNALPRNPGAQVVPELATPETTPNEQTDFARPRPHRPLVSFPGVPGSGLEPPDPYIAAGPSDVIVSTNSGFQVYTKGGAKIGGQLGTKSFFGVPSNYNIVSDPKFIYDWQSGRYFGVEIGYSNNSNIGSWFVVVSDTSNASGTWKTYRIDESGLLPDYPGLGYCGDKIMLAANNFNGAGTSFKGTVAVALNKSQLLSGSSSLNYTIFGSSGGLKDSANKQIFTIQPAKSLSVTNTCHLASVNGTSSAKVQLYQVTGVPTNSANATLTTSSNLAINAISSVVSAQQPGTTKKVAAGDNRTLDVAYRDGNLWTTFNNGCTFSGTKYDCARLLGLSGVDTSPAILSDSSYGGSGYYYTYPAVSIDSSGCAGVVFTRMSKTNNEYPSLRYGSYCQGALQSSVQFVAGTTFYTGSRWGDFFGAAYDATTDSLWFCGEYKITGNSLWYTYVTNVTLP